MTLQNTTLDLADMDEQDFQDLTPLTTTKKSLPTGIATNVKQHTVITFDRSSSMFGAKIAESNQAREALLQELADPNNKDGFLVSVIDFNHEADRIVFAESAQGLKIPPSIADGFTSFEKAVGENISVIQEQQAMPNDNGWHFLRPISIFMSDGQSDISDRTIRQLHELSDVMAIAFGDDADQDTLKRIASDGKVHVIGASGGKLRKFLAQVGVTMSDDLANA